jgi:hypothetical protein
MSLPVDEAAEGHALAACSHRFLHRDEVADNVDVTLLPDAIDQGLGRHSGFRNACGRLGE